MVHSPNLMVSTLVPDSGEDPKSRFPNSGFTYAYGADYRTLRWIYFLNSPRGRGWWLLQVLFGCASGPAVPAASGIWSGAAPAEAASWALAKGHSNGDEPYLPISVFEVSLRCVVLLRETERSAHASRSDDEPPSIAV